VVAKQVADWLDYRGSTDDTAEFAESASPAELEILRLAKLPAIKYEQERKAAAESLGFRASMLDRLVGAERARLGFDDDSSCWPSPSIIQAAHGSGCVAVIRTWRGLCSASYKDCSAGGKETEMVIIKTMKTLIIAAAIALLVFRC
jgi:hypothetical protein